MAVNRGKQFEEVIKKSFLKVPDVSIDRLHDQTTLYKGSTNICDFIVYKEPYEYYIECKSVHGNTLSIHSIPKKGKDGKLHGFYGNITDTQWEGLLEKSKIQGVRAGVMCWWIDKDATKFIPIQELKNVRDYGYKSIRYDMKYYVRDFMDEFGRPFNYIEIHGKKKRVFFDYDLEQFFEEIENADI